MKHPLTLLVTLLGLTLAGTGCTMTDHETRPSLTERITQTFTDEPAVLDLGKASHILWIDLNRFKRSKKNLESVVLRHVKARVCIDSLGQVHVLAYEKPPHFLIEDKINRCLKTYRVSTEMMEARRSQPGEQVVYLRMVDEY